MKILITSGGTIEHIDEVRTITNISTGRLGSQIANMFLFLPNKIEKIYYVCSKGTILPSVDNKVIEIVYANSANEVYNIMEKLVPKVDVVIHSMAVSDFGFKPSNIKLKSNDLQGFKDSIIERIVVNPKIISFVKKWNPAATLIGFKFEVNKSHEELIDVAYETLQKNNCDFVVANDKQEMKDNNQHIAYIIDKNKEVLKCANKFDIALNLVEKFK